MRKHASGSSAPFFRLLLTFRRWSARALLGALTLDTPCYWRADGHAAQWDEWLLKLTCSSQWKPRRRAPANGTEAGKLGAVVRLFAWFHSWKLAALGERLKGLFEADDVGSLHKTAIAFALKRKKKAGACSLHSTVREISSLPLLGRIPGALPCEGTRTVFSTQPAGFFVLLLF